MIPALRELWAGGTVDAPTASTSTPDRCPSPPSPPSPSRSCRRRQRGGAAPGGPARATAGSATASTREEQLDAVLDRPAAATSDEYGRTRDVLEIIAPLAVLPDADTYRRFAAKGVTGTMAAPWWLATPEEKARYGEGSLELKIATIERFAEEVIAKM